MARVNPAETTFTGGVWAPKVRSRIDSNRRRESVEVCQNYIPTVEGPAIRRSGTRHISEARNSGQSGRMIRFVFSITQAYMLLFQDQKIRFYRNQGLILEAAQADFSGATQADPCVITSTAHTLSAGDRIWISRITTGMTELNGREYIVQNTTANTFEIQDITGTDVDSTGFTAYTSGGEIAKIYEITSPYSDSELADLDYAQSSDRLYLTHEDHWPQVLTRTGHTSWTIGNHAIKDGPYLETVDTVGGTLSMSGTTGSVTVTASATTHINDGSGFLSTDVGRFIRVRTGAVNYLWRWLKITAHTSSTVVTADVGDEALSTTSFSVWRLGIWCETTGHPGKVTLHESRLFYAGGSGYPNRIDGTETFELDSFSPTTRVSPATVTESNAVAYSVAGDGVQYARWIASDQRGLMMGAQAAEWILWASTQNEALTQTNVSAKRTSVHGSANIRPVQVGKATIFVSRNQSNVMENAFILSIDGFEANKLDLLADSLTEVGISDLAYQANPSPVIFAVANDGGLRSVTYRRDSSDLVSGWASHVLGGQVDDAGTMAKVLSIEVIPASDEMSDELWLLVERRVNGRQVRTVEVMQDRFGELDKLRDAVFLDSSLSSDNPVSITGATQANPVVITAASHGYSNGDEVLIDDVLGMSDLNGNTYLVSNKTTNTFELTDLDGNNIDGTGFNSYVSDGESRKKTQDFNGLWHLEGETISVMGDGIPQGDVTVSNGAVTIDNKAGTVHLGYKFTSRIRTMTFEVGGTRGVAHGKNQKITEVGIMVNRTLGLKVGTTWDDLRLWGTRKESDKEGVAPPLFSGQLGPRNLPIKTSREAKITLEQTDPYPGQILAILPEMNTKESP